MRGRSDRIGPGLENLADEVARLAERVTGLAARVAALEKALGARGTPEDSPATGRPPVASPAPAVAEAGRIDLVGLLAPAGRACLALGGAYFLRALTESGRLPLGAGVGLGFLYALAWLGMADRAARRDAVGAVFHGLSGVLIALPILWEATTHFHLMSAGWSAAAAALFTAAAFAVARHRDLQALAGLAVLGATGLSLGLAMAAEAFLPFAFLLVGLAAAAWWLGDSRGWPWLRWPPAIASWIVTVDLWIRVGRIPPLESPPLALAAALLVASMPLVVTTWRTRRGEAVRLFDAATTGWAILLGLGAAFAAAQHLVPGVAPAVKIAVLLVGAAAYGAAVGLLRSRPGDPPSFFYYASLGLLLTLVATSALPVGAARDLVLAALALACAWAAARGAHPVFAAHGAAYAVAAAVTSGLAACAASSWIGTPTVWPAFPPTGAAVLVAALSGGLIPRRLPTRALETVTAVSRLALALVLVATIGSLVVLAAGPLVAGVPPDPGRLASLRTIVLSVAAVALALVARLPFGGELGWLAWPVLFAGGIKFLIEDFRDSTASTLFVSFAVYGIALILTARVRRGGTAA